MLLALLLACPPPEPVITTRETARIDASWLPRAGWDPIFMDAVLVDECFQDGVLVEKTELESRPAQPTVLDAEGVEVALEATAFHAYDYGWRAVEPLAPGTYTVVEADGRPMTPMSFTVQEHASEPMLPQAGSVYLLEKAWTPGIGSAVTSLIEGKVWLELLAMEEGQAYFRIVAEQDYLCEFFVGWAELSDEGLLTFELDELLANQTETPFAAYELRLQVGFSPDGTEAAGGEVDAVIDTRGLDGSSDYDICDILAGMDVACEPCPDDGEPECLPLAARASTLVLDDEDFKANLPRCGVDLSETELPTIEFDCSGTSCATGSPKGALGSLGLLLLLASLRRREPA